MKKSLVLVSLIVAVLLSACGAAAVPMAAPAVPAIPAGVSQAAGVVVQAAPEVAAVAVYYMSAVVVTYQESIKAAEQCGKYGMILITLPQTMDSPGGSQCFEPPAGKKVVRVAEDSKIPKANPNHHDEHTPTDEHPDAAQRARDAQAALNGNVAERDWSSRPSMTDNLRCIATTIDGEIVRLGVFLAYKATEVNVFGNVSFYDPHGRGWVSSFTDAKWDKTALQPSKDLRDVYQDRVQNSSIPCTSVVSAGLLPPNVGVIAP